MTESPDIADLPDFAPVARVATLRIRLPADRPRLARYLRQLRHMKSLIKLAVVVSAVLVGVMAGDLAADLSYAARYARLF